YCAGFIKRFDPATGAVADFASGITSPVDLQVSAAGDLYYLARDAGVFRVRYTANFAPSITSQPANRMVSEGRAASFTVTASGSAPQLSMAAGGRDYLRGDRGHVHPGLR